MRIVKVRGGGGGGGGGGGLQFFGVCALYHRNILSILVFLFVYIIVS